MLRLVGDHCDPYSGVGTGMCLLFGAFAVVDDVAAMNSSARQLRSSQERTQVKSQKARKHLEEVKACGNDVVERLGPA